MLKRMIQQMINRNIKAHKELKGGLHIAYVPDHDGCQLLSISRPGVCPSEKEVKVVRDILGGIAPIFTVRESDTTKVIGHETFYIHRFRW